MGSSFEIPAEKFLQQDPEELQQFAEMIQPNADRRLERELVRPLSAESSDPLNLH
jgi:hypothetical protein